MTVLGEAIAASGQQKPKPNGSSSARVTTPAFETAHPDVKALQSGSANVPSAMPSKNSQVNWSEVKCLTAPAMSTAKPLSFGYPTSDIGRPIDFDLGRNHSITNSQVNQGAVGQAAASPMAKTASPFIFSTAHPPTERFVGFSFSANPSIPGRQGNPSKLVHPHTVPHNNGLLSVFVNGNPDLPGWNLPADHGDTVPDTPNRASGPVKITFTAEPKKTADNEKKEKRKDEEEKAARGSANQACRS